MAERKIHRALPTNNLAYLHEKAGDKHTFWHSTTFQYICRSNVPKGVFISCCQKCGCFVGHSRGTCLYALLTFRFWYKRKRTTALLMKFVDILEALLLHVVIHSLSTFLV